MIHSSFVIAILIGSVLIAGPVQAQETAPHEPRSPKSKVDPVTVLMAIDIFGRVLRSSSDKQRPAEMAPDAYALLAQDPKLVLRQQVASALTNKLTQVIVGGRTPRPLAYQNGMPNYQGLRIAVMVFDPVGQPLGERPVNAGFTTGERFKLKVQPTFTGHVEIENISPDGARTRIYPPQTGYAIEVHSGVEAILPQGPREWFVFEKAKGMEQLIVTIRDPRAYSGTASSAPAYRQDHASGSYYVQPVTESTYPVITETIRMQHY